VAVYYEPEQVRKQLDFFDTFLLGKENGWREKKPKVNLEVREVFCWEMIGYYVVACGEYAVSQVLDA